jgi:hypothetical protein
VKFLAGDRADPPPIFVGIHAVKLTALPLLSLTPSLPRALFLTYGRTNFLRRTSPLTPPEAVVVSSRTSSPLLEEIEVADHGFETPVVC